ncbi:DUF5706 domain-containing protein [Oscillatoria laete-virens NRMC-F 0139]|nr:DUF5706 domain-containing protein [Oscillatoria laete-virens NRMC-F 0139]
MTATPPPTAAESGFSDERLDSGLERVLREHLSLESAALRMNQSPNARTVYDTSLDFTRLFYMAFISLDTQIGIADTKAQLIMAANTILVASIAFNPGAFTTVVFGDGGTLLARISLGLSLAMLIALVTSIFFALGSSRPNLRGSQRRNLFFFGHAAEMDEDDFLEQFMGMTMEEVKTAIIGQIHAKSIIVVNKYRQIRLSLVFLFTGLLLWIAARLTAAL